MGKFIDLTGQKFGKLEVIARSPRTNKKLEVFWVCFCDCKESPFLEVLSYCLRSGRRTDCGCIGRNNRVTASTIHGLSKSPEYRNWQHLRDRCNNKNSDSFHHYGGRGITVCDRWLHGEDGVHPFLCFLEDMGKRPTPEHSIDRKDVNGNYELANCRWATDIEQRYNTTRTILVTYQDKTENLDYWSCYTGISADNLYRRIFETEWEVERAFFTPLRKSNTFEFKGTNYTIQQLSSISGTDSAVIRTRLHLGWKVEDAVLLEVSTKHKKNKKLL